MKFGRTTPLQNEMLIPLTASKCNPEVVFQYDGHWFLQSGNSYTSAVYGLSYLSETWLVD